MYTFVYVFFVVVSTDANNCNTVEPNEYVLQSAKRFSKIDVKTVTMILRPVFIAFFVSASVEYSIMHTSTV